MGIVMEGNSRVDCCVEMPVNAHQYWYWRQRGLVIYNGYYPCRNCAAGKCE